MTSTSCSKPPVSNTCSGVAATVQAVQCQQEAGFVGAQSL